MPKHRAPGLTPRQRLFVLEYLVDLNATRACIRAGYSAHSANVLSVQLMRKPQIEEAIKAGMAKRQAKMEITAERVLEELAKIGFANMGDYFTLTSDGDPVLDFSSISKDQAAALAEVTVDDYVDGRGEDARDVKRIKFKLCDKRAALVDIGRHLGMFPANSRLELTGKGGGPILTRSADDLSDADLAAIATAGRAAPVEPEEGED